MTIIAFNKGVMASDGRCVQGWTVITDAQQKLFKLTDGSIVGGSGRTALIRRYVDWLDGKTPERPPLHDASEPKESGSSILLARPDGALELHSVSGQETLRADWYAIGCGADLAIGAMEMGATAEEAVRIAIRRNMGCGGEVQAERL